MDENRRRYQRFDFPKPVAYSKPAVESNGSLGDNISVGGIALKVNEFIPVGSVLEVQLQFSNPTRVVQVQGKVVRIRESIAEDCYEVGLEFIKNEQSIRAIGEYIIARRSQPQ